MTLTMSTGDLKPDLEVTLSSPDEAVDVSTATAVRVIGKQAGAILFDRDLADGVTAVAVGDTSVVTMEWEAGDTDVPGRIYVEVEVTWPGTLPQTFRLDDDGVRLERDFDYVEAP